MKIASRLFTIYGASGLLVGIANMYLDNTLTAVKLCVEALEGGSGSSKLLSNRYSGPSLGS